MLAQHARLDEAREKCAAWTAPFARFQSPIQHQSTWTPAEGWVTREEERDNADPLSLKRIRHDVATVDSAKKVTAMDVLIQRQAALLKPHLQQDVSVLDQAERITTTDGGVIRVVNKVCTVYARPIVAGGRAPLEVDEESDYDTKPRTVSYNSRKLARNKGLLVRKPHLLWQSEPAPPPPTASSSAAAGPVATGKTDKPPPPPLISLRFLQRRWLPLGYNKNKVGTALSVRYTRPWTSTHMAFDTMRFFCTGTNNRVHDRALIKYVTVPYMFEPLSDPTMRRWVGRPLGAIKRTSQNIVASQRLPRGRAICLGLFNERLSKKVLSPDLFKSIVINHEINRATLLFYAHNIICVGTSSFANLAKTYEQFAPDVVNCYNTPENLELERDMIRQGTVSAQIAEDVLDYVMTATGELVRKHDIAGDPTDSSTAHPVSAPRNRKRAAAAATAPSGLIKHRSRIVTAVTASRKRKHVEVPDSPDTSHDDGDDADNDRISVSVTKRRRLLDPVVTAAPAAGERARNPVFSVTQAGSSTVHPATTSRKRKHADVSDSPDTSHDDGHVDRISVRGATRRRLVDDSVWKIPGITA